MDEKLRGDAYCGFCGEVIAIKYAASIAISVAEYPGEVQQVYAHKTCLVNAMNPIIPLHPGFHE